jgi:cytochrome c-type biogenesis protein CcmH
MRWLSLCIVVVLTVLLAPAARAVLPDEMLPDPVLEARARALSKDLRCMVCQNQSIDDSEAPLARDLRVLVRERLTAGDSDQQVIDFLVARYGEFVLLNPRFAWHNLLLWLGPPGILLGGAVLLLLRARRNTPPSATDKLTPAEEARLTRLLDSSES